MTDSPARPTASGPAEPPPPNCWRCKTRPGVVYDGTCHECIQCAGETMRTTRALLGAIDAAVRDGLRAWPRIMDRAEFVRECIKLHREDASAALRAEAERLRARIDELSTPDIFGLDGENDTATSDWGELADDHLSPGAVANIWQNRALGHAWIAFVRNEAGDIEPQKFDDETEARQAAIRAAVSEGSPHAD